MSRLFKRASLNSAANMAAGVVPVAVVVEDDVHTTPMPQLPVQDVRFCAQVVGRDNCTQTNKPNEVQP